MENKHDIEQVVWVHMFEELYRGADKHVAVSGFTGSTRVSPGALYFTLAARAVPGL